jgi:integrase
MGNEFRAWLLKQPAASKTARDRFIYVKALLGFAHRELELIDRHPWDRMNIESTTESKRTPWTSEQIKAFFALPLFTSYQLPTSKRAGADAAYWIPLLGLFTGARSAELCQLTVLDVVEEQGIFVIDINEDGDGKKLKTSASQRKVPIHSELIRLGFLDYVQDMKDAGHSSLWPHLHLNPRKPSHGFSLWFNQDAYRSTLGNEFPDFHALRHTVRSAMSAANVPEPDQDNITGHTVKGSTGTRVYRHIQLDKLRQSVEAIRYPTFSLARTYPKIIQQTSLKHAAP